MRNKLKSPAIGAAYSLLILLFAWLLLFCLSDLVRLFLSETADAGKDSAKDELHQQL